MAVVKPNFPGSIAFLCLSVIIFSYATALPVILNKFRHIGGQNDLTNQSQDGKQLKFGEEQPKVNEENPIQSDQPAPKEQVQQMQQDTIKNNSAKKEESDDSKDQVKLNPELVSKLEKQHLGPPDHFDGLKLEKDGHLNHDYRKEVFLGEHEDIENSSYEDKQKKIKDLFDKVDEDKSGTLSLSEVVKWITQKVKEHFEDAARENTVIFQALDPDHDGLISWDEFYLQFLVAKGVTEKEAEKMIAEDKVFLDSEGKDQLIRNKFKWSEADIDNDNKLSLKEFKGFMHPESSEKMLRNMVTDILDNLDKNHDGILEVEEFAALPEGELEEQFDTEEWRASDRKWQEERRQEFRKVIDTSKDGLVTKDELLYYVDPKNPTHARNEAQGLFNVADENHDGLLSWAEVFGNMDMFFGSKMFDTAKKFHDEF